MTASPVHRRLRSGLDFPLRCGSVSRPSHWRDSRSPRIGGDLRSVTRRGRETRAERCETRAERCETRAERCETRAELGRAGNSARGSAGAPFSRRRGITLFEVLLALAIFLGALAAIGQIVDVGTLASSTGQLQSQAVLRCETKLAEIISGIEPLSSVDGQGFDDDPSWTWSLAVADGPRADLLQLTVEVTHARTNGTTDAAFSLTRLVRDPQLFIDAAAAVAEQEGE